MIITKRSFLKTVAATGFVAAAPWVARAQSVKRIRFAHATAETHPMHIGALEFKKRAEAKLPGRLEIQIFPNRQLGDDRQVLEQVVAGTLEVSACSSVLVPLVTRRPALDAFQLPFLIKDYEHFERLAKSDTSGKILADLERGGLVGLSVVDIGQRHFLTTSRPVKTLSDFSGVKVRIVPVPLHKAIWEAAGTSPVGLPYGEVYSSMQTKVIDGLETNVSSIVGENLWEVGKHLSLTGHYFWPAVFIANKMALDGYDPEIRKAIVEAAQEVITPTIAYTKKQDLEGREELKKKGVEITEFNDVGPMREKMKPILDSWASKSPLIAEFIQKAQAAS
jgi:TRAP-type transport system periplasmic protein